MEYLTPKGEDKLVIVRGSDGAVLEAGTEEFAIQVRHLPDAVRGLVEP